MGKIVAVHSFRGGTGKSNTVANLAYLLVKKGKKVGIVDCDIQSPGIHIIYQISSSEISHTLNEYLWGQCKLRDAVYEVIPEKLFMIPSSLQAGEIARILREGYDAELLISGLQEIIIDLDLDYLWIDTHPGLNEETLLSISITDKLLILLRPDHQDYQGTATTVEISKQLDVPDMHLIINKCPRSIDQKALKEKLEEAYEIPIAGMIPLSEDMVVLGSSGIFVEKYPDHEVTKILKHILDKVFSL